MTTAALILLHTQTFINELLLEQGKPLVSVKHTHGSLMSSLSTHSRLSVSFRALFYNLSSYLNLTLPAQNIVSHILTFTEFPWTDKLRLGLILS